MIATLPALTDSVAVLKGVGPRTLPLLESLGLHTLWDCLTHLPLRYEDRRRRVDVSALDDGQSAWVEVTVDRAYVQPGRKAMLVCDVSDTTGEMQLRFFHFYGTQVKQMQSGAQLRCFGEAKTVRSKRSMIHPEYHLITEDDAFVYPTTLTPVYAAVKGVSQTKLRQIIAQALVALQGSGMLSEPDAWEPVGDGPTFYQALVEVHAPQEAIDRARNRLAYDELLAHTIALMQVRRDADVSTAYAIPAQPQCDAFLQSLPFALTGAQQRVLQECQSDITANKPMLRLLQGDVGAGKTVVAATLLLQTALAGQQAVMMAPTEILAEQHAQKCMAWFAPFDVPVVLLTGSLSGTEKTQIQQMLLAGVSCVVIGTHALLQDTVTFDRLGLVVIDEQHRFGVNQRLLLREKSGAKEAHQPHVLSMTATPIPRTLSQLAFAHMDCSVLDEKPAQRQTIQTVLMSNAKRAAVMGRVRAHCTSGQQAYWVCPAIDESETGNLTAATQLVAELTQSLTGCTVALLHGRMKSAEKESTMRRFVSGDVDVLLATTVVEVGVDVPNATLMVIENAERFGLSQLHQLRGRVGRGDTDSYCVLLYQGPLTDIAQERLTTVRSTNDGFVLAEADLNMRGPGELLGTRQSGVVDYRVFDVCRDQAVVRDALSAARTLLEATEPHVISRLRARWRID